jgi:hypothetical protein
LSVLRCRIRPAGAKRLVLRRMDARSRAIKAAEPKAVNGDSGAGSGRTGSGRVEVLAQDQRLAAGASRAAVVAGTAADLAPSRRRVECDGGGVVGGDLEEGGSGSAVSSCGLEAGEMPSGEALAAGLG